MTADVTAPPPRPWGYVASFLWVVFAFGLSVAVFMMLVSLFGDSSELSSDSMSNGALIAQVTFVSTTVEIVVLAFAAHLAGWHAEGYLGWIVPPRGIALRSAAVMAAFVLGYDALTYFLHRDVVTSFQTETYRSAQAGGQVAKLWLAFVVAAPLGEEIVFRGFLFRGWVQSRSAVLPGIVLISVFWAATHIQYDWFGMLQIFLTGLILGWARWQSGSTLLTFGLHAMINAWATLETMAALG